jgi:Pyridoxamine 5'-phosphate oxidase
LTMDSWAAFAEAEPELAGKGRALLYQRGDGEGLLTTVAANGTPRIHPLNVGVKDGSLLVFVQGHSAKARDLETNPHYALHAHVDPAAPHEFMVRGEARLVTDAATRQAAAAGWFFTVSDTYPLYELLIEHALIGERDSADDWPPRYRSWRSVDR